jgi:hypothetical protein
VAEIELILHPGYPKTGTSVIQATCAANRRVLAKQHGLLYPATESDFLGVTRPNHQFIFWHSPEVWKDSAEIRQYFVKLREFCDAQNLTKVLISWERFSDLRWMEEMRTIAPELGMRARILVYHRRQDYWIESAWKQWFNKLPEDPSISQYALEADGDWYAQTERWASYFGRENITLRVYEKQQLKGGLVKDFFDAVGISADVVDTLAPAGKDNASSNVGFSRDVMALLTHCRGLSAGRHDHGVFHMLGSLLDDSFKKREFETYSLLSPAQRIDILQRWEESNQKLARDYLGRADGRLFYEPWPKETDPWMPFEGVDLARAAPIFMRMFMTLNEQVEMLQAKIDKLEAQTHAASAAAADARALSYAGAKSGFLTRTLQSLRRKFLS